jgi:ParB family chromosome partitioning protein
LFFGVWFRPAEKLPEVYVLFAKAGTAQQQAQISQIRVSSHNCRFRALGILGHTKVPVIVRDANEQQKLEFAIIENVQRQELNAIEEAKAYIRLSEEFGLTQEQIAERVGKSRPQIANTIRLLQLPKEIQDGLMEKKISASNARTILSLPNDHERLKLYYAMIANNFTVRQTEERVAAPRQAALRDPNVTDFEDRMRAWLRCRVVIKEGAKGAGEIKIKYSSPEEFKTLIEKLSDKKAGE